MAMQAHHVDICQYARECSPYEEDERTLDELKEECEGIVDLDDLPEDDDEAREHLLYELGESEREYLDFLEVEILRSVSDESRAIVEFLLGCGGPTVRVTVDLRYDSVTLFHSWGYHVQRDQPCDEWEIYDHRDAWLEVAGSLLESYA